MAEYKLPHNINCDECPVEHDFCRYDMKYVYKCDDVFAEWVKLHGEPHRTVNWNRKFTDDEIRYIRKYYENGDPFFSCESLAEMFEVQPHIIRRIAEGKIYKDVT